jgi:hypothetical protein
MGILTGSKATPRTVRTISFGMDGNCAGYVAGGWSAAEPGYRWMIGPESELRIDDSFLDGDYIIEFDLRPFVSQPLLPSQRLTVSVNGVVVGQSSVDCASRLGYRIPATALSGSKGISVLLSHPDAARPCDIGRGGDLRKLSLLLERMRVSPIRHGASGGRVNGTGAMLASQLEQRVGLTADRLMLNFESLGDDCEFALVQRRCGAEPFLSLLRFAGIDLASLLRAIDVGMEDFGDAANIEIYLDDKAKPEYIVREKRYGVIFHTFRSQDQIREEQLRESESKRLAYCAQRFVGDLRKGSKIFVLKRNVPLRDEEILPLYATLASYGRNVLLWMVPADAAHAPGSVEVVLPGLFKGFISRFAPRENINDLLLGDWLEVCANAYRFSLAERMKLF